MTRSKIWLPVRVRPLLSALANRIRVRPGGERTLNPEGSAPRYADEPRFPHLAMIGMVETRVERNGTVARERRCYLFSTARDERQGSMVRMLIFPTIHGSNH
jgi:hypothetical protein